MSDKKVSSKGKGASAAGNAHAGNDDESRRRFDDFGSLQPQDEALAKFIVREFQNQQPQAIDVFPITGRGEQLLRLRHIDVQPTERISFERAVQISNEIIEECQVHCNLHGRKRKEHRYDILICDTRRGGVAAPVAARTIILQPQAFRIVAAGAEEAAEEDEELSAVKMMQDSVRLIHDKERWQQENEGKIVGETMLLLKGALADREAMVLRTLDKALALADKVSELSTRIAERSVEAQAIAIEAANAEESRLDQRARRERDNMWNDVTKASLLGAVDVMKQLFPGFGALFLARLQGKDAPPPPQLMEGTNAPAGAAAVGAAAPQATIPAGGAPPPAPLPEEKKVVDRFIDAAEKNKMPDGWTSAERLFGKDDDTGKPLAAGIFDRAQVVILSTVHTGKAGVDTLDALLPDSGKPEAIREEQLMRAMAYLTPPMLNDCLEFLKLRKEARDARMAQK